MPMQLVDYTSAYCQVNHPHHPLRSHLLKFTHPLWSLLNSLFIWWSTTLITTSIFLDHSRGKLVQLQIYHSCSTIICCCDYHYWRPPLAYAVGVYRISYLELFPCILKTNGLGDRNRSPNCPNDCLRLKPFNEIVRVIIRGSID